ncbi:AI-2E family transporter [Magnetospirillum aberrantis]|uniref:AI-2E family transporter n=1 Tax=Magnetospirillum aberrantis SpK TaxID=908842 RepID=A0A7C9QVY7_9PROT|nr:AI-2E family transporter [Magnetospirillum aberrantis]NFV81940.1 AI-2E family transporter [Magnetospirillum aberrantis SpK]
MTSGQRLRFWLIGLALALALLYVLRGMLLPFVAGMAVAYFLDPLADRLERAGLSRLAATSVITASFFMVVVVALVILVPVIEDQVLAFAHKVPGYVDTLNERLQPLLVEAKKRLSPRDIEKLRSSVGEYAGTFASWGLGALRSVLSGSLAVFNVLSLVFITPVVTFYLLRDWDKMVSRVDSWLPRDHADTIRTQMKEINRTLSGFIRGQATVCLCLGLIYGIGLSVVGLDLGLVIGLGAGVLSFIPYLGSIAGFVTGMGLALAQGADWHLPVFVAVVFAIGQVAEGNFLTPKLVGDKVGLHPVWIMFALLAFAALFGFVGLLLAVPLAAVIGVLVRFALGRYLSSPLYHGHGPQ